MKHTLLFLAAALLLGIQSYAQNGVAINTTGADADNSAILDVSSTNKGFLPPRMTGAQRDAISSPVAGLTIWCSNCGLKGEMQVYNGAGWTNMTGGAVSAINTCGTNFIDSRDGKSYTTVQIGYQCWMAENLNVGARIDGGGNQTNNNNIEKYCYNNDDANCATYGGLYQWDEMMQYVTNEGAQGICPTGWHLPTDGEWSALTTYLGGESGAGGKMKETGFTHWNDPNEGATNSSGFTGLPGGYRTSGMDAYVYVGNEGALWSSTPQGVSPFPWHRAVDYANANVFSRTNLNKVYGLSVRCLRNN